MNSAVHAETETDSVVPCELEQFEDGVGLWIRSSVLDKSRVEASIVLKLSRLLLEMAGG